MNTTSPSTTKQVFRVIIQAPVEKVWATLTQKDVVLPFFFNSVMKTTTLAAGAPIQMRTPNGKYVAVVGDVLEFDPPRRFSHTFKFTNLDDPACVVTYELKPIEGGTEFTLTSERVPVGTKTEKYMAGGGKFIANVLKAYVETGRPSLMARFVALMNVLTGPFTPAKCRTEHWPLEKKVR